MTAAPKQFLDPTRNWCLKFDISSYVYDHLKTGMPNIMWYDINLLQKGLDIRIVWETSENILKQDIFYLLHCPSMLYMTP